jgi:hypothetical protein
MDKPTGTFELPRADQHTFTVGRNGSGKTQMGMWLLSESDFDIRPHIIIDFKREDFFRSIPYAHKITTKDQPPKHPGVYIAFSGLNDPWLETFLARVWKNNNTHLHIDETYMVPRNSPSFNAILTQGRSKRISMNCLSQRPSNCSRWITSEAKNFCVFHLNHENDRETVEKFIPYADFDKPLPEYHSHWYNVTKDFYTPLLPAPDAGTILDRLNERLKPRYRYF